MRYKLIDANSITFNSDRPITADNIIKMPCIYADLPNGIDGNHYVLAQTPKHTKCERCPYGETKVTEICNYDGDGCGMD